MIKPIDPSIDQIGVAVCCSARFLIFFPVYCLMCPPVWSSIGGRSFVRLFVGSFVGLIVGSLARWLVRSRKKKKKNAIRVHALFPGRQKGGGGRETKGRGGERRMLGVFCTEAFSLRLPLGGCGGENVSGEESLGGRGGKACPFSGVSVPSVIVVQKLHCHRSKWWTLQVRVKCGGWSWSCCCLGRVRLML